MIRRYLFKSLFLSTAVIFLAASTSCTVDENASLFVSGSSTGTTKTEPKTEKKTDLKTSVKTVKKTDIKGAPKTDIKTAPKTNSKTASKTDLKTGSKTEEAPLSWSEKMKAEQERRKGELAEKAAAKDAEKAALAAAEAKAEAAAAKQLAATRKVEAAAQKAAAIAQQKIDLAEKKRLEAEEKVRAEQEAAQEAAELAALEEKNRAKTEKIAAEKKAREDLVLAKEQKREAARVAKMEAKQKAEADRVNRDNFRNVEAASRSNRGGGGFFSRLSVGTASKEYQSEGHDIYVNEMLLPTLSPSNAKIEISLGEQRARVFRKDGPQNILVIETPISSGKPGHATGTGNFQIKEKLVSKQSTLYGTWVNSAGQTVGSSGDSRSRPPGASRFVGADMPYWMRINGGIGLHIGYVPGYPASHGCIRVPEAIQPLIFSKVGVGSAVTILH